MRFKIETPLPYHYKDVFEGFTSSLFLHLAPSKKMMQLERFDGSQKGDEIHIKFLFPVPGKWVSLVTNDWMEPEDCGFIDEGLTLPFGLKSWKHKHIIQNHGDHCVIVDDISFTCKNKVLEVLQFPGLWFSFYLRKPKYKSFFKTLFHK